MERVKYILAIAVIFFALEFASGCTSKGEGTEKTYKAMDTVMSVTIYDKSERGKDVDKLLTACGSTIENYDNMFSVNSESSDVFKINASAGKSAEVSAETAQLIARASEISKGTGGLFDITVYPLSKAWGFTDKKYGVPSDAEIAALLGGVGYNKVSVSGSHVGLENGSGIDLGGIAKGYVSQMLANYLKSNGVQSAVINLGGNVQVIGSRLSGEKWGVGIRDPLDSEKTLGILSVSDTAVVTSGSYERYFEKDSVKYHHIIDPRTGKPADSDLVSVSIIACDGTTADALSTALFVMGSENAAEYQKANGGFEYVMVTKDKTVIVSPGIRDAFTLESDGYSIKTVN
ncbi:MAG: FAD:protein FMN transferase [Clostridiales bacterium]|nr:FAD:protein FMN transferase [Clostridiales bacterium]